VGERWLHWFPAQDLAPATLETYAQKYRRQVRPCFGERALSEITGLDLVGFPRRLPAQGLAPSTVTVVRSVIRDTRGRRRRRLCPGAVELTNDHAATLRAVRWVVLKVLDLRDFVRCTEPSVTDAAASTDLLSLRQIHCARTG
jgi:hypothetical protein